MLPSELIRKSADLINEYGWCKINMFTREGHMCLMGALRAADGEYTYDQSRFDACYYYTPWRDTGKSMSQAWQTACKYLDEKAREALPEGKKKAFGLPLGVADFNDYEETSQEDVLLFLKEAAYHFEQEGQ